MDKINLEMAGWTINSIRNGSEENVLIFDVTKNGRSKLVTLCANDLGDWPVEVKELNRAVKKKKHEQRRR
jgi:hypothetical protein